MPKHSSEKAGFSLKYVVYAVILIAVLFFGYRAFVYLSSPKECKESSLSIHEISNEQVLCVFPDNSRLQMILKNDGRSVIEGAVLEISGEKGKAVRRIENLNLNPGDIATSVVEYGKENGNIKKITITPLVEHDSGEFMCSIRKMSFSGVKTC